MRNPEVVKLLFRDRRHFVFFFTCAPFAATFIFLCATQSEMRDVCETSPFVGENVNHVYPCRVDGDTIVQCIVNHDKFVVINYAFGSISFLVISFLCAWN